jgi:hypothetical protein
MIYTVQAEFMIMDRVYIDGCENLVGVVTAVQWRHPEIVNYEVSWISNGESKSALIEYWRLKLVEP